LIAETGGEMVVVQLASSLGERHCLTPSHILPHVFAGKSQAIIPIAAHICAVVDGAGATVVSDGEVLTQLGMVTQVQAPDLHVQALHSLRRVSSFWYSLPVAGSVQVQASRTTQRPLRSMVLSGQWQPSTQGVAQVWPCTLPSIVLLRSVQAAGHEVPQALYTIPFWQVIGQMSGVLQRM
jgi:hypothetical protein